MEIQIWLTITFDGNIDRKLRVSRLISDLTAMRYLKLTQLQLVEILLGVPAAGAASLAALR